MDILLLSILGLGLLFGQTLQVPLAGLDAPVIDIAVGIVLLVGGLPILFGRVRLPQYLRTAVAPLAFFGLALILSWLFSLLALSSHEAIVAALYLVRILAYLAVPLILISYLDRAKLPQYGVWLIWTIVIFALLGFLQLALLPDFRIFEYLGWDPHQGRLLSTFLDPNFAGIWLTVGLGLVIALGRAVSGARDRITFWIAGILITAAVFLTASRSALLALVAILVTAVAFKNWRWLWLLAVLLVVALAASPRLHNRIAGIWQIDETAGFRLDSWQAATQTWFTHPIFGVGYNALPYRRYEDALPGTVKLLDRADAGYDSSLLTIAATSGTLGLLTFLFFLNTSLMGAFAARGRLKVAPFNTAYILATLGLFVASWFVNAWLYPPILLTWLVLFVLALKESHE